jgi:hypothetical protein
MPASAQVERIILDAHRAAKREQQGIRLAALLLRVRREIAFNSLGHQLAGSHDVWGALVKAETQVKAALALVERPHSVSFPSNEGSGQ